MFLNRNLKRISRETTDMSLRLPRLPVRLRMTLCRPYMLVFTLPASCCRSVLLCEPRAAEFGNNSNQVWEQKKWKSAAVIGNPQARSCCYSTEHLILKVWFKTDSLPVGDFNKHSDCGWSPTYWRQMGQQHKVFLFWVGLERSSKNITDPEGWEGRRGWNYLKKAVDDSAWSGRMRF